MVCVITTIQFPRILKDDNNDVFSIGRTIYLLRDAVCRLDKHDVFCYRRVSVPQPCFSHRVRTWPWACSFSSPRGRGRTPIPSRCQQSLARQGPLQWESCLCDLFVFRCPISYLCHWVTYTYPLPNRAPSEVAIVCLISATLKT